MIYRLLNPSSFRIARSLSPSTELMVNFFLKLAQPLIFRSFVLEPGPNQPTCVGRFIMRRSQDAKEDMDVALPEEEAPATGDEDILPGGEVPTPGDDDTLPEEEASTPDDQEKSE